MAGSLTKEEKEHFVTDRKFAEARGLAPEEDHSGKTSAQLRDEIEVASEEEAEEAGAGEAGESEEAEEAEGEGEDSGGEEAGESEEAEEAPAADVQYPEVSDVDLQILPEAVRGLARRALEKVREKDKVFLAEAMKGVEEKTADSVSFHEAFRDWEAPLLYAAKDQNLQEVMAGVMGDYFDNLKAGMTPEEAKVAVRGGAATRDSEKTKGDAGSPGKTPAQTLSPEIRVRQEEAQELERMEKELGLEEGVLGYFDKKSKVVSLGVGQAVADHVIGQVNKILKESLGPVLGRIQHIEGLHVERSIQEQERDLVREHGTIAKELLKKDLKTSRSAIDDERLRAYKQDGETISIRTAFDKLAAKRGIPGKSKRQRSEAFALRARQGKRASAGPAASMKTQAPTQKELERMSSEDIRKLIAQRQ